MLLHDPDPLIRLLTDRDRPVQLVIAGKAHPADQAAQEIMIKDWIQFMRRPEVLGGEPSSSPTTIYSWPSGSSRAQTYGSIRHNGPGRPAEPVG